MNSSPPSNSTYRHITYIKFQNTHSVSVIVENQTVNINDKL